MKKSVAFWNLTGFYLIMLVLGMRSVAIADDYPKKAVKIPNTSILPNKKLQPVPDFIGQPATKNPIAAAEIPQNPFMGDNPWNCIHNNSYMSDTYPGNGPLGIEPIVTSTWLGTFTDPVAIAVTIVFDKNGLLVTAPVMMIRAEARAWVQLTLIHPKDLTTLAVFPLPEETITGPGFRPAGSYFFIDKYDRIVIGTKDRTIWVVSYSKDGLGNHLPQNPDIIWDLTDAIPEGDAIEALQPDWSGRLWFTSKGGVVGTLDMGTGKVLHSINHPGERIVNGHAAGKEGGVYIASTLAMYRFDFDEGEKKIVQKWRKTHDAGTHMKEGQTDIGTGTTPTLMGDKYVTITDNGQPSMHVLVYNRENGNLVCSEPVFRPGQASNENSLIATDKSIIVENNFGYKDATKDTTHGRTTKPGIARIDVENDLCHTVWTNESVSIPSVVSKMSLANGLIYTYTKPKGPGTTDPWYFTAIDFRTGEVVFNKLAGVGIFYNNHYAGAYIGPDGTLYVGVLGGIVAMRDRY